MRCSLGKKQGRFKDDIRRAFIIHSVVPVSLVTFVCLFIVIFFWYQTVVFTNNKANEALNNNITEKLSVCTRLMDRIVGEYDIPQLQSDAEARADVYQTFYRSAQNLRLPLNLYILDDQQRLIASSNKQAQDYHVGSPDVSWGIIHLLEEHPEQQAIYFDTQIVDNTIVGMSLTLGKAFAPQGAVEGSLLLQLDCDALLGNSANSSVITIITDCYDHVLAGSSQLFYDVNRRLVDQIIGVNGYISYDGAAYYCTHSTALDGSLSVYTLTEVSVILFVATIGVIVLLVVLFSVAALIYINSRRISVEKTAIIDELMVAFEEAGHGNLDYRLNITTNDEFESIGDSYNQMLKRMKELIRHNQQQARETIISELRQLESQFNPHFLFNTLETIRCMADIDNKKTSQMILWLADLLRYSIREEKSAVPLKEDIAYTLNYLRIQKGRFGRNFNYDFELRPEAENCLVPKLIIQPLIENAFKHGFDRKGKLLVTVLAEVVDAQLVITITDNGSGIPPERLEQLRYNLAQKQEYVNSMGLYNVNRRIWLMYGPPYGLSLDSTEGSGTTVQITLPALYQAQQADA